MRIVTPEFRRHPVECDLCGEPVLHEDAGADVRLYLGPGDKLAELWLTLCHYHLVRFREAGRQGVVECRVGGVTRGTTGT